MKIKLTSVFVNDQEKALKFYTEVLGFVKKNEISLGEFKWLTVESPESSEETELLLEPNNNPAAKIYQTEIFKQGIPANAFNVENVQSEFERLQNFGVIFTTKPTNVGTAVIAVFNDTCGNLIQIYEVL